MKKQFIISVNQEVNSELFFEKLVEQQKNKIIETLFLGDDYVTEDENEAMDFMKMCEDIEGFFSGVKHDTTALILTHDYHLKG